MISNHRGLAALHSRFDNPCLPMYCDRMPPSSARVATAPELLGR
jgi:hypothetical protein